MLKCIRRICERRSQQAASKKNLDEALRWHEMADAVAEVERVRGKSKHLKVS